MRAPPAPNLTTTFLFSEPFWFPLAVSKRPHSLLLNDDEPRTGQLLIPRPERKHCGYLEQLIREASAARGSLWSERSVQLPSPPQVAQPIGCT